MEANGLLKHKEVVTWWLSNPEKGGMYSYVAPLEYLKTLKDK